MQEKIKETLDSKPLEERSPYLEVAEVEIEGVRYRKVVRYAGLGRHRRQLPVVYEVYKGGRWRKIQEEEV